MAGGFAGAGAASGTGGGTLGVVAGAAAGVEGSATGGGCVPEQPSVSSNARAVLAWHRLTQVRVARPELLH
ncbi:hypothetical protein [Sorangium cellulosum]|uniref:hypothetical protein n=1 Tax=Sorangium TaxID=39643 RepID=UPI000A941E64|nr:hypothetical protein [Sorangium cellulosum]